MTEDLFEKPLSQWTAQDFQEVEASGGLAHLIARKRAERLADELDAFRAAAPLSGGLADVGGLIGPWLLVTALKRLTDEIRLAYPDPRRRPAPTKSRAAKNRPPQKKIS